MKRKRKRLSSSVSEQVIGDFAGRPVRVIIVVISLIVILFPLYWLIANSLRTKTDYLANPPILFNAPVTFQNYQKILESILSTFIRLIFLRLLLTVRQIKTAPANTK